MANAISARYLRSSVTCSRTCRDCEGRISGRERDVYIV